MMHIMLARGLWGSANLTFITISGADAVTRLLPIGSVVVRVVGPGPNGAQMLDRLLRGGQPVARRLHFAGRQIEGFLPKHLMRVPASFEEGCHLCGNQQFTPYLFTTVNHGLSGL